MTAGGPSCEEPRGHGHIPGDSCVTCGDAAEWMRVVEMNADDDTALCVDARAPIRTVATELVGVDTELVGVDTGLVGTVARGDALLVHAGVAIHHEARETAHRGTASE